MNSASSDLPKGRRRGANALVKVTAAYRAVFTGNGGKMDAEVVKVDLAEYTGFYTVAGLDVPNDQRAYYDGQRSVFARIFRFLKMTESEIAELEAAARHENVVSSQEGTI